MARATYDPITKEYVVYLTRAEAHVHIWGGRTTVVNRVQEYLRQALVAEEDLKLDDNEYRDVLREVGALDNLPSH